MTTKQKRNTRTRTPDTRVRIPKETLDALTADAAKVGGLEANLQQVRVANESLAQLAREGQATEQTVLGQAAKIVAGDRQQAYGDPKSNFDCAAGMVSAYLTKRGTTQIDAHDWALINVLGKVARQAHSRTGENLVDMAGYVRTAEMVDQ